MRLREGETCQGCTVHSRKVRVQIQACLMPIPLTAMPGRLPGGVGWGEEAATGVGCREGRAGGGLRTLPHTDPATAAVRGDREMSAARPAPDTPSPPRPGQLWAERTIPPHWMRAES